MHVVKTTSQVSFERGSVQASRPKTKTGQQSTANITKCNPQLQLTYDTGYCRQTL